MGFIIAKLKLSSCTKNHFGIFTIGQVIREFLK